jgi:hypothetical protein|tara:strand:+ start:234 stop:401 length:168 start_codon:yes stop_codon:yes gene_type:complete
MTYHCIFYTGVGNVLHQYVTNSYKQAMYDAKLAVQSGLHVKLLQNGNTITLPEFK